MQLVLVFNTSVIILRRIDCQYFHMKSFSCVIKKYCPTVLTVAVLVNQRNSGNDTTYAEETLFCNNHKIIYSRFCSKDFILSNQSYKNILYNFLSHKILLYININKLEIHLKEKKNTSVNEWLIPLLTYYLYTNIFITYVHTNTYITNSILI